MINTLRERGRVAFRTRPILSIAIASLAAPVALSLVATYQFVTRLPDDYEWMLFGFHDKRWLITLYFAWFITFPVSLAAGLALARNFDNRANQDQFLQGAPDLANSPPQTTNQGRATAIVALVTTLGMAWYLWGPPWGGGEFGKQVDGHESLHFKGIQAILSGGTPYVDAGSDQYGPASQLFTTAWIQYVGEVSVIDIRVASVALHFAAIVFCIFVAFRFLGTAAALLGSVLAMLIHPTWGFFQFFPDGMVGPWGWANVWRYAGLLLLGAGLPWVLSTQLGKRRSLWLALIGIAWAATFLVAQENFIGGVAVLILLAPLLITGAGVAWRSCLRAYGWVVLGAGATAIAYAIPYALSGNLTPFVRNYFLVPLAVSSGYSNTPWWEDTPWIIAFYGAPVASLAIALALAVFRPPHSGMSLALRLAWLTAFGTTIAALVAQAGALTRSDASHLVNSYALFPFMVAAASVYLARRSGGPLRFQAALALALAFAACLPFLFAMEFTRLQPDLLQQRLSAPLSARAIQQDLAADRDTPVSASERRQGDTRTRDLDRALSGGSTLTPEQAARFADKLRNLAAGGTVYLDPESNSGFGGHIGFWYFLADVRPFPVPFEEHSMAITVRQVEANRRAVTEGEDVPDTYVTALPDSPASQAIVARMGPVVATRVDLGEAPLTVLRRR